MNMGLTLTEKILKAHLVEGEMKKGTEIGIRIDQTLTQDATGTMAYLEFEAMNAYSNRIRASWSKWFRREYLLCNNLFYEEGVFWEDVVHTLKAFYLADTVIYHPVIGYIYIQTPNSDMRGVQSGKKYADTIRFCTQSLQFLLEKHASPNIKNHLSSYYLKVLRKYKNYLSKLTETEIDAFIEAISDLKMNVIEQFFGNKEHDWLLNDSSIRELYNHQRK